MRLLKYMIVALAFSILGCTTDIEIRGKLDRVIGENITLELIQGELPNPINISLRDAENRNYNISKLSAELTNKTFGSFSIPPSVAQGPSTIHILTDGNPNAIDIPLNINRLLITMHQESVYLHPLFPATLSLQIIEIEESPLLLSLSNDGNTLAILSEKNAYLFSLGKNELLMKVPRTDTTLNCIAAFSKGFIVGYENSIDIHTISEIKKGLSSVSIPLTGVKAISATTNIAVVLHECDSLGAPGNEADCVTRLKLDQLANPENIPESAFVINEAPTASLLSLSNNGQKVVLVSPKNIYGIAFDNVEQSKLTALLKDETDIPVAIAKAYSTNLGEIFAIAFSLKNLILFVGFNSNNDNELSWIESPISLGEIVPSAISFGRNIDLYVASTDNLFKVDIPKGTIAPFEDVTITTPIKDLVVQP